MEISWQQHDAFTHNNSFVCRNKKFHKMNIVRRVKTYSILMPQDVKYQRLTQGAHHFWMEASLNPKWLPG